MPTLAVEHLGKRYRGTTAVDDVSFTIAPGEILGYVGHNGAGKSTTVKMMIGLLQPTSGRILYDGRSILDDLPGFQRRLGYVPEEPNLYPFLTGREYLLLCGRLRGMESPQLDHKIDELLRLFSLAGDGDSPVSSYSKGMRQKVLLSAAQLHNPDILILDEPLSGLDAGAMIAMRELLQELAACGKAILYSSHVLDAMEKVCTRVLILRKGRVVAYDTIDNLRRSLDQPSLEAVFTQINDDRARRSLAAGILEAIER